MASAPPAQRTRAPRRPTRRRPAAAAPRAARPCPQRRIAGGVVWIVRRRRPARRRRRDQRRRAAAQPAARRLGPRARAAAGRERGAARRGSRRDAVAGTIVETRAARRARTGRPGHDPLRRPRSPSAVSARTVANRRIRLLLAGLRARLRGRARARRLAAGRRRRARSARWAPASTTRTRIPAGRGTIFDRPASSSRSASSATTVYAEPAPDRATRAAAADAAAQSLGLDADTLYAAARRPLAAASSTSSGRPTRRRRRAARSEHLPGLGFYREERRDYPQGTVAAQVVGYAGVDNRGLAGLELALDRALAGPPGRADGRARTRPAARSTSSDVPPSATGSDVFLDARPARSRRTPRTVLARDASTTGTRSARRRSCSTRARARSSRWPRRPAFDANSFSGRRRDADSATAPSRTPTSPARPSSS